MSAAETIYSARIAYPDYLVRGRGQVVSLELYRDGALASPTGGTFALYDPGGTEVVAPTSVTVDEGDAFATYSIAAGSLPTSLPLGHGYREEWSLACADGVTRPFRRDAALVLYAAFPVVTDADLTAVYSDLDEEEGASFTTFQPRIDEAWKRILGRLEQQGIFPEHIVTSWSLREVHVELALHLICLDNARAAGGRWLELAASHKKEFELAWSRLKFVKASSSTANADSDAMRAPNKGVTHTNASPRASWRGFGGL